MNLWLAWRRPKRTFGVDPDRSISISVAASRGSLSGNDWSRSDFVIRSAQIFPRSRVIVLSVACHARDDSAAHLSGGGQAGQPGLPREVQNAALQPLAPLQQVSP